MSDKKVGFALVGCGVIGAFHLESVLNVEGAELIATMDVVPERAHDLAEKYGARAWYSSLDDLLADKRVDLVSITTPSGLHAAPAMAAARAGKHVLVEKPMAVTLQQADEMIAAARQSGVKLGCIFQRRYESSTRLIKEQIDRGRFGRLVVGNAHVKWNRPQSYYDAGGWRGTWALDGGGALSNQSIHVIDLLQWMMGPVESVQGMVATRTHRIETEDLGLAIIRFQSGALGVVEGTTSTYAGPQNDPRRTYSGFPASVEILGENGTVIVEDRGVVKMWRFADRPEEEDEMLRRCSEPEKADFEGRFRHADSVLAHKRQIEDMVRAVQEGREPQVNGEEGRKALELLRAIYYSALSGQPVKLPLSVRDESPRPVVGSLSSL